MREVYDDLSDRDSEFLKRVADCRIPFLRFSVGGVLSLTTRMLIWRHHRLPNRLQFGYFLE